MIERAVGKGISKSDFTSLFQNVGPVNESSPFRYSPDLIKMHAKNEKSRMHTIRAMQQAITPLVDRVFLRTNASSVLEVGCGTGFFGRYLAPVWLKRTLVSFDINEPSLGYYHSLDPQAAIFQGNIYQLGVKPESMDAVIGLSSFDSFMFIEKALQEATDTLKPGGLMILIQDVVPELWADVGRPLSVQAVETYHDRLLQVIKNQAKLSLLEGEIEYLEGQTVRSDKQSPQQAKAGVLAYLNNLGEAMYVTRSERRFLPGLENKDRLRYFSRRYQTQRPLDEIDLKSNQILEWARLRYLVAQKK